MSMSTSTAPALPFPESQAAVEAPQNPIISTAISAAISEERNHDSESDGDTLVSDDDSEPDTGIDEGAVVGVSTTKSPMHQD